MPLGLLFWLLYVLWIVLQLWGYYPFKEERRRIGSFVMLAALLFVIGWRVFGFIIQN